MNDIVAYIYKHAFTFMLTGVVILLCFSMALEGKASIALSLSLIPTCAVIMIACVRWPGILLVFTFIVNYIIMGLGRYISLSIPVTVIFEMLFFTILLCQMLRSIEHKVDWAKIANLYWMFSFIWISYCLISSCNGITGQTHITEWYKTVRQIAFYPLLVSLIVSLHARDYRFIRYFLVLWGILVILAAAKGYWQRNKGFDQAEWIWLMTVGRTTHLINTGVRYFSFFTDAANFGCGQAMAMTTFGITALYVKDKRLVLFYLLVALCGGYSMLISGTRAALAAPIVGSAMYAVLCKNWKVCAATGFTLALSLFFLVCTNLGDDNKLVHRMRTAFDKDDASMNVRYENQKALKAYMKEAPFGIGLGLDGRNVSPKNKFYLAACTAPDSDWVNIWIRLGEVGLIIYLVVQAFVFLVGSFYVLFCIKNNEIRGPLMGMLCGCGGLMIASYANMVYFQFPNGPIVYTCLTLVFMGKMFDKQYSEDHDIAKG